MLPFPGLRPGGGTGKVKQVAKTKKAPQKLQAWLDARKRHRLSHAQVQMARELGMNPAKFGKLDNHRQESWKLTLPEFIEELYFKRFGKLAPDTVLTLEERERLECAKKEARREAKQQKLGGTP